jgi:hypothetical protein
MDFTLKKLWLSFGFYPNISQYVGGDVVASRKNMSLQLISPVFHHDAPFLKQRQRDKRVG